MLNVIYESPPLSLVEYSQLEKNIIADGCREPLVVFNNTLVDGHNRYEICTKHDLPFSILDKEFTDSSHAKEWMILNQFGRRNLINYQRSVLALELESVFSERAKENQAIQFKGNSLIQKSEQVKPIVAIKEVAKVANVSHDTIAKVKKIQSTATQEVKDKLESGSDNTIAGVVAISLKSAFIQSSKVIDFTLLIAACVSLTDQSHLINKSASICHVCCGAFDISYRCFVFSFSSFVPLVRDKNINMLGVLSTSNRTP